MYEYNQQRHGMPVNPRYVGGRRPHSACVFCRGSTDIYSWGLGDHAHVVEEVAANLGTRQTSQMDTRASASMPSLIQMSRSPETVLAICCSLRGGYFCPHQQQRYPGSLRHDENGTLGNTGTNRPSVAGHISMAGHNYQTPNRVPQIVSSVPGLNCAQQ